MNDTVPTTFVLSFPKQDIAFEGSSDYAQSVGLASMGHLSWVLEHLIQRRKNPLCIDVGANIGLTTLLMDQFIIQGSIYSFEPHPKTFGELQRNIAANQLGTNRIQLFPVGLGTEKGELQFRDSDRFSPGNSILREGSLAGRSHVSTTVSIERLDDLDLVEADQRVDLLKIDVEGFELDVLSGGSKVLDRTDVALVEFNHWCLTTLARIFPEDALARLCDAFTAVYVYDRSDRCYHRISSDADKWSFLHDNMVKHNVDDLLCTSSQEVIDRLTSS